MVVFRHNVKKTKGTVDKNGDFYGIYVNRHILQYIYYGICWENLKFKRCFSTDS